MTQPHLLYLMNAATAADALDWRIQAEIAAVSDIASPKSRNPLSSMWLE